MNDFIFFSDKALALLKTYEGFRSKPYADPVGYPTIGYGSRYYENGKEVTLTDPAISEKRAEELLRFQVKKFENGVKKLLTKSVSQSQFDALVLLAYNIGLGGLQRSNLLKKVNANPNDTSIKSEFLKFVYAKGVKLAGLVKRRTQEANLYFSEVKKKRFSPVGRLGRSGDFVRHQTEKTT